MATGATESFIETVKGMINFDATQAAVVVIEKYVYGIIAALPSIIIAMVIFIFFWILARIAGYAVSRFFQKTHKPRSLEILASRLVRWFVYGLGFLISMSIVFPSVNAQSILSGLGIGSVAIGFAFKDIFQNWLAGILILLTRPFRIGDLIITNGDEGIVQDIQVRATVLKTEDKNVIVIPNSELFTNRVTVIKNPERKSNATLKTTQYGE